MPSSVIRSMQYSPSERRLDIVFRDGRGTYRYFDVPEAEWKAFLSAPSKGTYLNQTFKAGSYGYEKLAASSATTSAADQFQPENDKTLCWGEPLENSLQSERRATGSF